MVLESQVQQLYDEVHHHCQHFSVEDAQILHDTLSRNNGRRLIARVIAHRFQIPATLVMALKKKYK